MAKVRSITGYKPKHPELKLSEALKEKPVPKEYDKKFVSIKAPGEGGDTGSTEGMFVPTDDQLAKINQFTRTPKTAEEVACFTTMSCNDIVDRDFDQFTSKCIDQFASLEGSLSPVGKSYMVGHDTTKLPVGRIFDVGTKKKSGAKFLTNDVYIPNTESNKQFIENLDYGVFWAVSVGVVLGKTECSVCGDPFSGWGYWCVNGHDKGYHYDPDEEDTDMWGFPLSLEAKGEDISKGVLGICKMEDPNDFYELSQVYLGAQYLAELDKSSNFGGLVKAASAAPNRVLNISKQEALALPLVTDKVEEALRKFDADVLEDGTIKWEDDEGLIWMFEPGEESGEVLCLGKAEDETEEEEEEVSVETTEETAEETDAESAEDASETSEEEPAEDATEETEEDSEQEASDNEEEEMSKELVLSAAAKSGLPLSIMEKISDSEGSGLEIVLGASAERIKELEGQVATLTQKSTLGEAYLQELKADTIHWYTIASKDPTSNRGVNTERVEKLLAVCGENVELIKELREEYKEKAQLKFPGSAGTVRRSSFEKDPNEVDPAPDIEIDGDRVKQIHG